ncbi:A disintegrin and metalloproteinase with thrombospondin motifs 16 [Bombyx mori]|uniref:Peptidase M12B domain-containing protein n=1 Tax=Bombyx mori TaxID=7091 RepID=A0A8R2R0A3_BOMMO|nr:A disintegrin and metalloproteinase with thrombospondin motifs 16 [Bombyx mori]
MLRCWRTVILAVVLFWCFKTNAEQFGDDIYSKELLKYLTEAEKTFLLGSRPHEAHFEVAHLSRPRRYKRSLGNNDKSIADLKGHLDIKLKLRNSFLDPHFLMLRRWSNNTDLVVDAHADDELDMCYYGSDNAALFICENIRGVVKSNDSYYLIHPLPERFHTDDTKAHIIIKRRMVDTNNHLEENVSCVEKDKKNTTLVDQKLWTKHRRKRDIITENKPDNTRLKEFKLNLAHRNRTIGKFIEKLATQSIREKRAIQPAIFVETAVFVDRDLYKHMTLNFPKDTERELVRFVLAMINAVQLLYHDPSLGRPVNFILKRLEILHEDPANLKRPHDIDRFLSNFCTWQRLENPPGDNDPLHWDHALILTGLDLYVVNKNGKDSSQVVGLAPVAGMCTVTSSCTVNEGRHFESVYVVAHEIGHNLGMRHDGPSADNGCDPSAFLMSPTLGSGKITWSQCSKNYLQKFLDTVQSRCLLDHGNSAGQLDHSAEGILPGERFDADQQCMLKYGRGSRHSAAQNLEDICRDLHCQRERYTWTSHPALEGTKCGDDMYCRGGECAERGGRGARGGAGRWGRWGAWSECASACLLDDALAPAAAGVSVATRRCNRHRHDDDNFCPGHDKKYQSCHAEQCDNVPRMTVREFADQICTRARDVDPDLIGTGLQRIDSDDVSSACAVWCDTRGGGYKSRGWSLPDGTACSRVSPMFCISGICQKFTCSSTVDSEFSLKPSDCEWEALQAAPTESTARGKSSGPWRRAAEWVAASGCHYHCIAPGAGLRLVRAAASPRTSIQLCAPAAAQPHRGCTRRKSPYQYATMVCSKYKERVRRLSGLGMQISPALEDPDRPCRIACQDERVAHRFYLVNGHEGWFPLGTACGHNNASYCVSGKCLEFGGDNTPVPETVYALPLLPRRVTRSLTARIDVSHLDDLITALNLTHTPEAHITYYDSIPDNVEVDFNNPIHISPEDTLLRKKQRPTWD